jgi:cell division protein FtsB
MTEKVLAPEKIRLTKRYLVIAACGLFALTVGLHEVIGQNGYLARRRRRIQIEALTADIQKLKQENSELNRKIKDLRSDPSTIEMYARKQGLGRTGDLVVTLAPPQPTVAPPSDATPAK